MMFFVSLSDGIMSYVTPVILEESLSDPLLVGIVLSISSFFGIFFDFFVAERFRIKPYKFFIFWTIAVATLFPLSFLVLPKITISFIISMIIWSTYYELRGFSKYNFVHHFAEVKHHPKAFSITNTAQWLAYMIGPLIAVYLLNKSYDMPMFVCLGLIAVAGWFYLLFSKVVKKSRSGPLTVERSKSLKKEYKIFRLLFKTTAPLLAFNVVLVLLDVTFWSTGILYAEELRQQNQLGGLFMTIYGIPALFVGIIAPKIFGKYGKKRTSFALGILAGLSLTLVGVFGNIFLILGATLLAATFSGIIFILMDSVFEDYVVRLKSEGNDIVSINQITTNLAYAVGPIVLGFISKEAGYSATFVFSGILFMLVSVVVIAITPRKIKMPQKNITSILEA